METESQRFDRIERTLDAVAGTQAAMSAVVGYLLAFHRGNPQAIATIGSALEHMRVDMMNSPHASDYKAQAFDEIAETLLSGLT